MNSNEINEHIPIHIRKELKARCKKPFRSLLDYKEQELELYAYAAGRIPNATISDVYSLINEIMKDEK